MKNFVVIAILALCACSSCQTVPKADPSKESAQEIISAVGTMTQGLTNKNLSEADLKRLGAQVQKDPEAQSALKAVNAAFNVQEGGAKYCPIDGKHFSSRLDICPDHKVKLKPVE